MPSGTLDCSAFQRVMKFIADSGSMTVERAYGALASFLAEQYGVDPPKARTKINCKWLLDGLQAHGFEGESAILEAVQPVFEEAWNKSKSLQKLVRVASFIYPQFHQAGDPFPVCPEVWLVNISLWEDVKNRLKENIDVRKMVQSYLEGDINYYDLDRASDKFREPYDPDYIPIEISHLYSAAAGLLSASTEVGYYLQELDRACMQGELTKKFKAMLKPDLRVLLMR